jgi:hypothetical protein
LICLFCSLSTTDKLNSPYKIIKIKPKDKESSVIEVQNMVNYFLSSYTFYAIGFTPNQTILTIKGKISAYSSRLNGTAQVVKYPKTVSFFDFI